MKDLLKENELPFEFAWPYGKDQYPDIRWFAIKIEDDMLITKNSDGKEVAITIERSNDPDDFFLIENKGEKP